LRSLGNGCRGERLSLSDLYEVTGLRRSDSNIPILSGVSSMSQASKNRTKHEYFDSPDTLSPQSIFSTSNIFTS